MLWRIAAISLLLSPLSPAWAQQMKEVVDDRGRQIAVPVQPDRIVSLFDGLITVPLVELGAPVVGSIGDIDLRSGEWRVFGLQDVLGLSPDEIDIANIGQYAALDLEAIQALEPDLIIVDESRGAIVERLEHIAPVFVQEVYSGQAFGVSPQEDLAQLVGRAERFEDLDAQYKERVKHIKTRIGGRKTVSAVIVWDQLTPMWPVNGLTQALRDLGLELTPITAGDGSNTIPISPEVLPQLEADIVIFFSGYGQADQSQKATRAELDQIVPGWDRFLPAAQEGRVVFARSSLIITPSLASAHRALDLIEAYLDRAE